MPAVVAIPAGRAQRDATGSTDQVARYWDGATGQSGNIGQRTHDCLCLVLSLEYGQKQVIDQKFFSDSHEGQIKSPLAWKFTPGFISGCVNDVFKLSSTCEIKLNPEYSHREDGSSYGNVYICLRVRGWVLCWCIYFSPCTSVCVHVSPYTVCACLWNPFSRVYP